MKTVKISFGAMALIFGLIIAFTSSAFTSRTEVLWHINEGVTSSDDLFDADNYTEGDATGCDELGAVPCVVDIDGYADLPAYLASFSNDEEALIQDAKSTRSN